MEGSDLHAAERNVDLRTEQAFDGDAALSFVDELCTSGDDVAVGKYAVMQFQHKFAVGERQAEMLDSSVFAVGAWERAQRRAPFSRTSSRNGSRMSPCPPEDISRHMSSSTVVLKSWE